MTVDASLSINGHAGEVSRPWERAVLWAGVPLCALGLATTTGIASQWRGGRFAVEAAPAEAKP